MSRKLSSDDLFANMHLRAKSSTSSQEQPQIDWKETKTTFVFKADVPGLKREEVTVEVKDRRVLQLRGEKNRNREEANNGSTMDTWYLRERKLGKFMRKFELHENVIAEDVSAKMEDGVLTVTLPKEIRSGDIRTIPIFD